MKHSVAEEIWVVGDETTSNAVEIVDANGDYVAEIINPSEELTALDRARIKLIAKAPEMALILLKSITQVTHGPKKADVEKVLREAGVL